MANDHYIARGLTRPWEFDDEKRERQLRFFDFATGKLGTMASRNLFARRDLNTRDIEEWLNEEFETPLLAYVRRCQTEGLSQPRPGKEWRAVVWHFWLNTQRRQELSERPEVTLEDLAAAGEVQLEAMAQHMASSYRISVRQIDLEPFFPETGGWSVPTEQGSFFALPLAPNMVLTVGRKGTNIPDKAALPDGLLVALSVGVGGQANRVVLPPSWRQSSFDDPDAVVASLLDLRALAQKQFNLVDEAARSVGLPGPFPLPSI